MTIFGALWLLVAIAYIHGTSAQPFVVNNQRLPNCDPNAEFGLLATEFDGNSNPCTGYLTLKVEDNDPYRLCSGIDVYYNRFHREAAERYCYMLGINMGRPASVTTANLQEQVKLFECREYTGSAADLPKDDGTDQVVVVEDGSPGASVGALCDVAFGNINTDCYAACYRGETTQSEGIASTHRISPESVCALATMDDPDPPTDLHPFWALTCSDINECTVGVQYNCSNPFTCFSRVACGPNANCRNLVGSYTCSCPAGYEPANGDAGDPYNLNTGCTVIPDLVTVSPDVDECVDSPEICGPQSQCYNTPGSYICFCRNPAKYDRANNICLPVTCPQLPIMLNARPIGILPASPALGNSVIYQCLEGYEVRPEIVPSPVLVGFGYDPDTAYAVTCTEDETWQPEPFGMCKRISCGDPGIVCYANRTGSSFLYEDEVTFTCKDGFEVKDYGNRRAFERTCEDDGSWTRNYECVDIDECNQGTDTCAGVTRNCINTIGSYFCSCVPWSEHDGSEEQCMEWGGLIDFPRYEPCEMVERLGLCRNGQCEMEDDQAYCRCDIGYEGELCDNLRIGPALIIAIVALVLVIIVIIICVLCICVRWICRPDRLVGPPPYPAPLSPPYGGFLRRPQKPGRPPFY